MREIKFRGLRTDGKGWVYGGVSIFENEAIIYDCNCVVNSAYEVILESVGQFTGLHDENGKEIYQGDNLKVDNNNPMTVGWSKKFASFILDSEEWIFSHWFGESCDPEKCIVIGNIHENSELLK